MHRNLNSYGYHCPHPHPRPHSRWLVWAVLAFIAFSFLMLSGCTSTVVPPAIVDVQPSWDGNQQNSGLLGFDADGFGLITEHARDRYNALSEIYGGHYSPPNLSGAGLSDSGTNGVIRIDKEHLVRFATMQRWKKEGRAKP